MSSRTELPLASDMETLDLPLDFGGEPGHAGKRERPAATDSEEKDRNLQPLERLRLDHDPPFPVAHLVEIRAADHEEIVLD